MIFLQIIIYVTKVDNVIIVVKEALENGECLGSTIVVKKLLCFRVDGVSTFKGMKIRVIKQINTNYAPFPLGFITWLINVILNSRHCLPWE
jgi:hypothetical protein